MIVFDLHCTNGHVFEAWFTSGASFDAQAAAGQLACPICGSAEVAKAPMAPAVPAKANRAPAAPPAHAPAEVKAALTALAAAQAKALEASTWVGPGFARQARAMHEGEQDHAVIHGQATPAEAKALIDDGIPVAPLPFPVVPPEALN